MPHRLRGSIVITLTAAVLTLASPDVAAGDLMWGTRGGDTMTEREHQIALSFERGYAELVVRRTLHNGFDRHDEAIYQLLIPNGAVASGLRTLGERHGKPHWYAADLLEAQLAATRYRELTGMDPSRPEPKDPALLHWSRQGELMLQVFPVAPNSSKSVEYTLDMPATWVDGRWVIWLDETGLEGQPAELLIEASDADDRLYVDEQSVAQGHRLTLDRAHELALVPRDPATLELELASVATGKDRALIHYRVLASKLSKLPKRARVVIALDLSRSLEVDELAAQRRAALAYLEHFRAPELAAEVAVFGFDHAIRPLTDGFVSADEASGALRGAALEQRNGSAVDLAFVEAGRLLGSGSPQVPKRVLLLTDFLTSSSRSLAEFETLAANLDAVVHLAEVSTQGVDLVRDDHHPWAPIAARTEGVVWRASASIDDDPDTREQAIEVFEEWARPVRIDALQVAVDSDDVGFPTSLAQDDGFEDQWLGERVAERMAVRGLLWNRPIEHEARRSRSSSNRWAALVFGSHVLHELDAGEMLELASRGGAVSPVTSYLAIEPGVRPSAEGLDLDERNTGLIGKGGGGGTGSGHGVSRGAGFSGRLDRLAWLDAQLNAAWTGCGGAEQRGTIALETTYDEIVEVELTTVGSNLALTTCMRTQTWALLLPSTDFVDDRSTWTIELFTRHTAGPGSRSSPRAALAAARTPRAAPRRCRPTPCDP